jgi:hypothetical protein
MSDETLLKIVIREFEVNKDRESVEEVERTCEVGPSNKLSLFTDMLGDPICRLRHSPSYLMLVCIISFTSTIPLALLITHRKYDYYLYIWFQFNYRLLKLIKR